MVIEDKIQGITTQVKFIHSSWINALPHGKLLEKLRKAPVTKEATSEYIERFIHLHNVDINVCSGIAKWIHFSKPEELQEIVKKAGAAQLSNKFSKTINQQEVKIIKQSLGESLYNFSLHEAPIMFPDVLAAKTCIITSNSDPIVDVIDIGYESLRIALENIPNNCIYKLPKQWNTEYYLHKNTSTPSVDQRAFHMNLIFSLFEISF